jgi:hypothetical protein
MNTKLLKKNPLMTPKVLQAIQAVPELATAYGRGLAVLQGEEVRYFPLKGKRDLPQRFTRLMMSYKPKSQVVIVNSIQLDENTPFMLLEL